jgi:hypothetical protein
MGISTRIQISGEYDIVSWKVLKDYSADRLNALTEGTIKVRDLLRYSQGYYTLLTMLREDRALPSSLVSPSKVRFG